MISVEAFNETMVSLRLFCVLAVLVLSSVTSFAQQDIEDFDEITQRPIMIEEDDVNADFTNFINRPGNRPRNRLGNRRVNGRRIPDVEQTENKFNVFTLGNTFSNHIKNSSNIGQPDTNSNNTNGNVHTSGIEQTANTPSNTNTNSGNVEQSNTGPSSINGNNGNGHTSDVEQTQNSVSNTNIHPEIVGQSNTDSNNINEGTSQSPVNSHETFSNSGGAKQDNDSFHRQFLANAERQEKLWKQRQDEFDNRMNTNSNYAHQQFLENAKRQQNSMNNFLNQNTNRMNSDFNNQHQQFLNGFGRQQKLIDQAQNAFMNGGSQSQSVFGSGPWMVRSGSGHSVRQSSSPGVGERHRTVTTINNNGQERTYISGNMK